MRRSVREIGILSLALAACAGTNEEPSPQDEIDRDKEIVRRIEARRDAYERLPQPISAQAEPKISGEVPDALQKSIKRDLADKLNVSVDAITVWSAQAVNWSDGSLGCARPDQAYTQAIVPGYRLILEHAATKYDYRAAESGYFFLCELPTLPQRPAEF